MAIQPGNATGGPGPTAPLAPGTAVQGELPKAPAADDTAAAAQPPAPAEPAPAGDIIAAQTADQALVSDLIGAKAVTAGGEDLGKVDDLILDRNGQLAGVVLSIGGFLGIGDKQVAVPWEAMTQGRPDQPLVVAMTKDQLEGAPAFMTLADQQAQRQAVLSQPPARLPAPGAGAQ